jgi:hypothetical protein
MTNRKEKYEQKLKQLQQKASKRTLVAVAAICALPHILYHFAWDNGQLFIGDYLFIWSVSCAIVFSLANPIVTDYYSAKVRRAFKKIRKSKR